jgi:hypothetical protein
MPVLIFWTRSSFVTQQTPQWKINPVLKFWTKGQENANSWIELMPFCQPLTCPLPSGSVPSGILFLLLRGQSIEVVRKVVRSHLLTSEKEKKRERERKEGQREFVWREEKAMSSGENAWKEEREGKAFWERLCHAAFYLVCQGWFLKHVVM